MKKRTYKKSGKFAAKQIVVYIEPKTKQKAVRYVRKHELTMSDFVRELIEKRVA